MYNFYYVPKSEYMPVKKEVIELINKVRNELRGNFTFDHRFIGSTARKLITCDFSSNIGYDFDVNLIINDDDEEYSSEEIKTLLIKAFQKHMGWYGYNRIENSTRVITIKLIDHRNSCIMHSCDFAIVYNYTDKHGNKRQQYIHYNKKQQSYYWSEQSSAIYLLPQKEDWLRKHNLWNDVRELYLWKKNNNNNPYKKSRSLYAETINELYHSNNGPKLK